MKLPTSILGLASLSLATGLTPAGAQTVTMPRPITQREILPATAQGAQHRYFGTLQSVSGQFLTIQLRNGKLVHVDAAQAFARKSVSEPLFRGKPTVIDGTLGTGGVLYATAVKRGAPLRANWGVDH